MLGEKKNTLMEIKMAELFVKLTQGRNPKDAGILIQDLYAELAQTGSRYLKMKPLLQEFI